MKWFFTEVLITTLFSIISYSNLIAQDYSILESDESHINIEFNFGNKFEISDFFIEGIKFTSIKDDNYPLQKPGDPFLPTRFYKIGIPKSASSKITILEIEREVFKDKFLIAAPDSGNQPFDRLNYNQDVYGRNSLFPSYQVDAGTESESIFRYIKTVSLSVSPFQFNPIKRTLIFNKKIKIRVDFYREESFNNILIPVSDKMTEEFINSSLINSKDAINFQSKVQSLSEVRQEPYWYDPNKEYFKIYLKKSGIYRLTFEYLVLNGVPLVSGIPSNNFNIYVNGSTIPLDIVDSGDSTFDEGDYIDFVGYPPSASPFVTNNIYNNTNIYWLSYQETNNPHRYEIKDGFPMTYDRTLISTPKVLHFEIDSIYEPLGYADNDNRDHWFWGKATAQYRQSTFAFEDLFNDFPDRNLDSNWISIKVNMHGMTNNSNCNSDHNAEIKITDQFIGNIIWDGQKEATFNKRFYNSVDSINIYPTGNRLNVIVNGESCPDTLKLGDEIRINWYEFEYERMLRASGTYLNFKSPMNVTGINRYWLFQWQSDSMKVLIPQKSKMIKNVKINNDVDKSVFFVDTVSTSTEYFCVSGNTVMLPDSINKNNSSNLRDIANAADYIIITHPNFIPIANQLANYRQNNFPDENIQNPRIKVVEVQQIYNEFSFGLMDPFALKNFIKYAFENWTGPAPSYIVLVGDMSHDYRKLLQTSRPNFIPSIPYFASQYGQAASDNMIVAITGTDVVPDLALGRISIETVEEGNIILQKIMNYPADNSKPWKQNVLLLASGISYKDQIQFGFNQATLDLRNNYISRRGYHSSIVLNYPDTTKPEQEQYRGGGPEIREQINLGATLINYYGHGGGYQWDLTFLNDDIYTLENANRLPMILSVTCYTAHFDDQNVFGEQFNKVQGKGSVGFLGSSALTYWNSGVNINNYIFSNIFNQKNYIIGKVVLQAKNQLNPNGINALQIALLTYLGDPVFKLALPDDPDFELIPENLTITPEDPVVGDSVLIQLKINNWGTTFPSDSVYVELFAEMSDTSYSISSVKIPSFSNQKTIDFFWYPINGGLHTITARINDKFIIEEIDNSDNVTSKSCLVFNISDPAILKPIDGYTSPNNELEFEISDIGYYANKTLKYYIEIDTSLNFTAPIKVSEELSANGSIVKWLVTDLNTSTNFWRVRIFDGTQYGRWSEVRSFTLNQPNRGGYYAAKDILKTYTPYNVEYSELTESLVLNTDTLPARPSNLNLIEHFFPNPSLPDSLHLTALTTDGTYLYFGNLWANANENEGKSRIYRIGTGNNGTTKGEFYGPFSAFRDSIKNSIAYHSDGNIYVAYGSAHQIVRINIATEFIDTVEVPEGLLRWDGTNTTEGPVYLTSDGQYIYNLTLIDSTGNNKYTVRVFDPSNSWSTVHPDVVLDGSSFQIGFSGFFVHKGYIYPSEYYNNNFMRKYRLSDGFFEEEWMVMVPISNFQSYYSWCYDWTNDNIYASVYRATQFAPKLSKFPGNYIDANGSILTKSVGPVSKWHQLNYEIVNPNNSGKSIATLFGYNSETKLWDTLQVNVPGSSDIQIIDPNKYNYLRMKFDLSDSSFNITQPISLKSVNFDYDELSDLYVEDTDIVFESDSLLQGFPIHTMLSAKMIGIGSDSLNLNLGLDSTFFSFVVKSNSDSITQKADLDLETSKLLFENKVSLNVSQAKEEYYYYNNTFSKQFYVARDSVNPVFKITFDGREIIDGDIISSEPEIIITVEDNSPLPLTPNLLTIQHNNQLLSFSNPSDSLKSEYTAYPNSRFVATWTPKLEDGEHILSVIAKDSSGNFINSTAYSYRFNVFNNPDLLQVYTYPNPFKDKTDFTFEVRGIIPPEELKIKVFTVAGRLIREIVIPGSNLQIGFNRIPWDGKDQDGDEIANGVYFYKIISKHGDEIKTVTQKLAKLK